MAFEDVYISIGAVLWVLTCILTIFAIGRYAFQLAFHEHPSLKNCHIVPGIQLIGENDMPWALLAIANIICYGVISIVILLPAWPVLILILINQIITASRKKRFG